MPSAKMVKKKPSQRHAVTFLIDESCWVTSLLSETQSALLVKPGTELDSSHRTKKNMHTASQFPQNWKQNCPSFRAVFCGSTSATSFTFRS